MGQIGISASSGASASGSSTTQESEPARVFKESITGLSNAVSQNFSFTTNLAGDYRILMSNVTNGVGNAFVRVYSDSARTILLTDNLNNRLRTDANGEGTTDLLIEDLDANTTYYLTFSGGGGSSNMDFIAAIYYDLQDIVVVNEASNAVSTRVGEWTHIKSSKFTDDAAAIEQGYLPVKPGTIVDGAIDYPVWSAIYTEFVSGNDIVFPADVEGMFLRNIGGNAGAEGVQQTDRTAVNGLSGQSRFNRGENTSANGGAFRLTGNGNEITNNTELTGDIETNPINRAYQLYTIIDTYSNFDPVAGLTITEDLTAQDTLIQSAGTTWSITTSDNPVQGAIFLSKATYYQEGNKRFYQVTFRTDEDDAFSFGVDGAVDIFGVQISTSSGAFNDTNNGKTGTNTITIDRSNTQDSDHSVFLTFTALMP